MVFDQFGAEIHISIPAAIKVRTISIGPPQQERESTTCECSGETKFGRGVECVNRLDFIQTFCESLHLSDGLPVLENCQQTVPYERGVLTPVLAMLKDCETHSFPVKTVKFEWT